MKTYLFEYTNGSNNHGMLVAAESPRKALNLIKKEMEIYGNNPDIVLDKISSDDLRELDLSVPIVHTLFYEELDRNENY